MFIWHLYFISQHGRDVLKTVRKLENTICKQALWQNHRHFNLRCIHNNVIPVSLKLKSTVHGLRPKGSSSKQKSLLQERIRQCELRLKYLQPEINDLECYLKSKLEPELWDRVKESTQDSCSFTFHRFKQRQRRKFDNLSNPICPTQLILTVVLTPING